MLRVARSFRRRITLTRHTSNKEGEYLYIDIIHIFTVQNEIGKFSLTRDLISKSCHVLFEIRDDLLKNIKFTTQKYDRMMLNIV